MTSKPWGDSSSSDSSPWKKASRKHRGGSTHQRSPGRWLALQALLAYQERDLFVSQALDDLFSQRDYDSRDRRFATELANEVVRRQLTLDTILNAYAQRGRENIEEELWTVLQLGCYQLIFASNMPIHAVLNETVELCQKINKGQAKGFVNGILRAISREVTVAEVEKFSLDELSPAHLPILKRKENKLVRQRVEFSRPIFSIPQFNQTGHLSQIASLPEFLVERFTAQFDEQEQFIDTALWLTTQGVLSLRTNLLETTREQLIEVLTTAGVTVAPGQLAESILVYSSFNPANIPGFEEGWFSVQDESALSAVQLLDPQPNETILDLCAAPGGKTTHMAERMQNTGTVAACDVSELRMNRVLENIRRLKLTNINHHVIEPDGSNIPIGPYDAVLVDVPCSNTGVLGKRPEARWRLSEETYAELIPLQTRLLSDALNYAKPGGRVVYSTCSIDQSENEEVVAAVLAEHAEWTLKQEQHHLPGQPC